jgi:hypothetical protein
VGIYLTVFFPEEHAKRNREKVAFHECRMHQTAPEFKGQAARAPATPVLAFRLKTNGRSSGAKAS